MFENFTRKLPGGSVSNCNQYYVFVVIMVVSMIGYYVFLMSSTGKYSPPHRDVLNTSILDTGCFGKMSWWPISHFVFYFILGLVFPDCDAIVIIGGMVWEVIEAILGKTVPNVPSTGGDVQYAQWWSMSLTDVWMNVFGYYTGKFVLRCVLQSDRIHVPILSP